MSHIIVLGERSCADFEKELGLAQGEIEMIETTPDGGMSIHLKTKPSTALKSKFEEKTGKKIIEEKEKL